MIFVDKVIDNYTIRREDDVNGIGRHYYITLENGDKHIFPSMTTILAYEGEAEYITNWKKSIGSAHAYAKTKMATDAGTELHQFCEYVLLRDYDSAVKYCKNTKDRRAKLFMKKILPHLQKYKNVSATEEFLFSLKWGIAGTTDAVVVLDGVIYILDFKTSISAKSADSIEGYYIQVAGYSVMWEEITGQKVDDAIILLVNPYKVQEFVLKLDEYKQKFIEVVDGFYNKYGREYQQKYLDNLSKM